MKKIGISSLVFLFVFSPMMVFAVTPVVGGEQITNETQVQVEDQNAGGFWSIVVQKFKNIFSIFNFLKSGGNSPQIKEEISNSDGIKSEDTVGESIPSNIPTPKSPTPTTSTQAPNTSVTQSTTITTPTTPVKTVNTSSTPVPATSVAPGLTIKRITILTPKQGEIFDNTKEPITITWDYTGFKPDETFAISLNSLNLNNGGEGTFCDSDNFVYGIKFGAKKYSFPVDYVCVEGPLHEGDYKVVVYGDFLREIYFMEDGSESEASGIFIPPNTFSVKGIIPAISWDSTKEADQEERIAMLVKFKVDKRFHQAMNNWRLGNTDRWFGIDILDSNGKYICEGDGGWRSDFELIHVVMNDFCLKNGGGFNLSEGNYKVSLYDRTNIVSKTTRVESPVFHFVPNNW